jgi:EAL domain-containing protein (putative c-di-GMP-specific phosphodiesterase class I)
MILDVRPNWLKLDRYFVEGCASDRHRRAVITVLRQLGAEFSAEVIAEGVMNHEDADTLRQLGITLMQGYLFSEPLTLDQARMMFAA